MSAQERDPGESYCAGLYWGGSDGLQQGLQDACHGHNWTFHHGGALRYARLIPGGIKLYHVESLSTFSPMKMHNCIYLCPFQRKC